MYFERYKVLLSNSNSQNILKQMVLFGVESLIQCNIFRRIEVVLFNLNSSNYHRLSKSRFYDLKYLN